MGHKRDFPKVVINVGGVKHEVIMMMTRQLSRHNLSLIKVMWAVLEKRPLTRLGMLGEAGHDLNITRIITA